MSYIRIGYVVTSKSTRPKREKKKPTSGEPLSLGAKPSRPVISKLPDRPTKTGVLKGVVSNKVPKASYLKQINTANEKILDLKSWLETHRNELEEKHSQGENVDAAFDYIDYTDYIDEQDEMIAHLRAQLRIKAEETIAFTSEVAKLRYKALSAKEESKSAKESATLHKNANANLHQQLKTALKIQIKCRRMI